LASQISAKHLRRIEAVLTVNETSDRIVALSFDESVSPVELRLQALHPAGREWCLGSCQMLRKTSGRAQLGVRGEANACSISDSYCQHLLELILKRRKSWKEEH